MTARLVKIIFLVLFSFGVFTSSSAQKKFQEGFIIDLKGDTIKGHLLSQRSKAASKSCRFKNEIGEIRDYNFNEILGYRFNNGKYYIAKEIPNKERIFMEYLIRGKANIYYYRDGTGDHFLIQKEGDELIELTEPQKVISNPTGTGIYKAPSKYRGKLIAILNDADQIQNTISKTNLESSSLVALAKEYHDKVCTTEHCIIYEREKNKVISEFNISGGVYLNQYNFGKKLITNSGVGYQLGIMASFRNIFFDNENFGIIIGSFLQGDNEYTLSKYNEKDIYNERVTYNGEEYIVNDDGIFSVKSLIVKTEVIAFKVPLILSHFIQKNKSLINIGIGISNRFIIHQNDQFRYNDFYNQYNKSINSYHVGGVVSAGIRKRINSSSTFMINLMGDYLVDPRALNPFLRLRTSQLSLSIGYVF